MPNRVDIAAFQKVMIVYNRNSGKQLFASMLARVNEVKKRLKQVIDPKSLEIVEIKSFEQVEGLAARICQEKYDWIIVAGGDGTLRAIIDVFAKHEHMPYVSVFPAGTVNLVAKELLMSNDPAKWVKRVSKGIVSPVQLGKANGHIFLTVAGIGFDSLVVDNVSELEKKLLSKLAYVWQDQYSISYSIDAENRPSMITIPSNVKILHYTGAVKPWNKIVYSFLSVKPFIDIMHLSEWNDIKLYEP